MKNRLSLAHYPLQSLPMATWVQSNAHWCKSVLIIVIFSGAFSAQAAPAKHAAHSSAVGHHAPVTRPLPMFEFRNVNTRDTYSEPCKDKTFSTVTNDACLSG